MGEPTLDAVADALKSSRLKSSQGAQRVRIGISAFVLLAIVVWAANYFWVGRPVSDALGQDSRNAGYTLKAHFRFYADPTTLVLDLTRVESASPADLVRGLLISSAALHESGRSFSRVALTRSHRVVFYIDGDAFAELGRLYSMGENPVFLVRTLPEKLYKPDGTQAFGSWSGGLLGVVTRQMEDVTAAGQQWARGGENQ